MLDPRTELANNHHSHDRWRAMNFAAKARKSAQNYENYRNFNGGGVQLRPDYMEEESGVCSPPLWKTSPSRSPLYLRHPQNNYRFLSPTSKAQAIAEGQWELMEMVKNMPESSYELSLRDLVEQNKVGVVEEEQCLVDEKNFGDESVNTQVVKVKRQGSKKNEMKVMGRNRSIDNGGLFLKMVFPFSFRSKKRNNSTTNTCARVSPKPESSDKSSKGVDKEWWKKRISVLGDSESVATSSNNSGSSGSRSSCSSSSSNSNSNRKRSNGFLSGCWPFFYSQESKSAK